MMKGVKYEVALLRKPKAIAAPEAAINGATAPAIDAAVIVSQLIKHFRPMGGINALLVMNSQSRPHHLGLIQTTLL